MNSSPRREGGTLRLQWRTIALGSCLVAVALLASAIVLINTSGDALASVALVLAILAFVIQIVTFIADSFGNAQRDREAQRIYAKTRALLARIDEKTRQTNDTVREQYDKLLDRLLLNIKTSVSSEPEGGDDDLPQSARFELLADVRAAIEDARNQARPPEPRIRQGAGTATTSFERWPPEQTIRALVRDGINNLAPPERKVLSDFATDWRRSVEVHVPQGLPDSAIDDQNALHSLEEQKFLRFDPDSGFYRLSGKGRAAARLFTPQGDRVPEYISTAIPWVAAARSDQFEA